MRRWLHPNLFLIIVHKLSKCPLISSCFSLAILFTFADEWCASVADMRVVIEAWVCNEDAEEDEEDAGEDAEEDGGEDAEDAEEDEEDAFNSGNCI